MPSKNNQGIPFVRSIYLALLAFLVFTQNQSAIAEESPGIPELSQKETTRLALEDLAATNRILEILPDSLTAWHNRLRLLHALSVQESKYVDSGMKMLDHPLPNFSQALRQAYRGAFAVVVAKHVLWPGTKMKYLDRGLPALDSAVNLQGNNEEIRYLRLVSCYYLPFFLGRKFSVKQDFTALGRLLGLGAMDYPPRWYLGISAFVLENGNLPYPERNVLEKSREKVYNQMMLSLVLTTTEK